MAKAGCSKHTGRHEEMKKWIWGDEAIVAFLPIARAARGGKDDDPSLDNHIDCLARTFVWRFITAKKSNTTMEPLDNVVPPPKPPAPTDDWLARYVRNNGPLSIHRWAELFPRRSFRYALYRFERLRNAERLTRAWMPPHVDGVMTEPLHNAPKPPKSRNPAMTAAQASVAITVPQAFGIVRKVAPEIFARFKPTLAKLAPDAREKECETAIKYAAGLVADADVSESSHAEVAKRALTECLRRSLRYVAPDNVVQFPGVEQERADGEANERPSQDAPGGDEGAQHEQPKQEKPKGDEAEPEAEAAGRQGRSSRRGRLEAQALDVAGPEDAPALGGPLRRSLLPRRGRFDGRAGWRWKVHALDRRGAGDDHRQAVARRALARRSARHALQLRGQRNGAPSSRDGGDAPLPRQARGNRRPAVRREHGQRPDVLRQGKRHGVEIVKPSVHALVDAIRDNRIDVVTIDPWVSVHQVDGNMSHLIQPIVSAFKAIAQATDAAIEIVARSRKPNGQGRELTEEDALGSVAFVNKTRDVPVLNKMAEADATQYGLAAWQAGDYFRVDTPKHTHRRSVKPIWRQKVSVSLGNRGPGLLDFATEVGVVEQWSPPTIASLVDSLEPSQIEAIKAAVAAGDDRESMQATHWAGKAVAKVLGLDVVDRAQKAQVKITLAALVNAGHFEREERPNPASRGRKCVHLVPADPEAETEE
jgi:hypothetical protein